MQIFAGQLLALLAMIKTAPEEGMPAPLVQVRASVEECLIFLSKYEADC
jgi:hypothetical protein